MIRALIIVTAVALVSAACGKPAETNAQNAPEAEIAINLLQAGIRGVGGRVRACRFIKYINSKYVSKL